MTNKSINRKIFTSPVECESSYYMALANGDFEQMADVWAKEDEAYCVLPSGILLIGYKEVIEYWRNFFLATESKFSISANVRQQINGVMLSVHNLIEEMSFVEVEKKQTHKILNITTNIYLRSADGWRMLSHQATNTSPERLSSFESANTEEKVISKSLH